MLLADGLVGPAREHLFHFHVTTLLERISAMWSRQPRRPPAFRDLHPKAWRLWFTPDRRGRAKHLLEAFGE